MEGIISAMIVKFRVFMKYKGLHVTFSLRSKGIRFGTLNSSNKEAKKMSKYLAPKGSQ